MPSNAKQAAIDAVTARLKEIQTNAWDQRFIWPLIHLALDAAEEQQASETEHPSEYWLIVYVGEIPIGIASTRARARRALKRIMAVQGEPRSSFTIHRVPGIEIPK